MPNNKAVVLLSGGLDSAVTLYLAKKKGYECYCLIFDYGQRHSKEIFAAKKIARISGSKFQIIKVNLSWKGSSLLDRRIKIPVVTKSPPQKLADPPIILAEPGHQATGQIPNTYVPARNIIFLSFALSLAEAINAQAIFIGAHTQDYSGYPDCRPEFYRAFSKAAKTGTKTGVEGRAIKITTPLINKNKAQIIKIGFGLGVPFEFTWSCYKGGRVPCGACDSCYYRAKGFENIGKKDPLCISKFRLAGGHL